ncbi:RING finger domain-containing protein [Lampris incognitus]|uniref:RING finger domain-containing protein n=1 Tax=Lampris incognitus TaxID=2546036 RepID=UPI0024B4F5B9|nr:RING finger domain-containing protein [Lampris incognitus]
MDPASVPHQGEPATAVPSANGGTSGEPMEVECPICYQEYNQYNKCPRMLECLHVFCTECLQKIQLCPCETPDPHRLLAIPCPLCRHLTSLERGDAHSLPCNSRILASLPPMAFRLPVTMAAHLGTVTQRMMLSLEPESRDTGCVILPTVSLRVQQMNPTVEEIEVIQQQRKTFLCLQLLALVFWVVLVVTCVTGVLLGPNFSYH